MKTSAPFLKKATAASLLLLAAMPAMSYAQNEAASAPPAGASADAPAAIAVPQDTNAVVEPFRVADEAAFFGLINLDAPAMSAVKTAVDARDWPRAKQAWADHLRTRTSPQWFWSSQDREAIMKLLNDRGHGLNTGVPAADRVLKREFNFVGVPKTLDHAPKWNQGVNDWTSVLNRFPYLIDLGRAYWATGDRRYAADFSFLINDWIDKNPVPTDVNTFGVWGNPWRALEDGLRIQNWMEAMQLFHNAPEFDAETRYRMTRSLVEHARYLRATEIRKGYRAGNWQIIEGTGLAYIGIMFPEFTESTQWRARGFQTLAEHMNKDVYPDGAHHELTPGYHMAVIDQFLQAALLSRKNGYDASVFVGRHEKMFEFTMNLSEPDRLDPPIADAGKQPIARTMADGALLYQRADMRYLGGSEGPINWVWTFGPSAFARYAAMTPTPPAYTSDLMPAAQYATLRTGWEKDDKYLLFDMAPWGGGHSHKDQLQIVAYAGRGLLVDSGQQGYDQPLASTYFRTTAAHNVLILDGREQSEASPTVVAWETTPQADFVSGTVSLGATDTIRATDTVKAAPGTPPTAAHQRSVLFLKPDYWIIVDRVTGIAGMPTIPGGDHEITRLFHLPKTKVKTRGNAVITTFPEGQNLQIQTLDGAKPEMRKGWIAVSSAKVDAAPVAAYITRGTLPQTLVTVLTPFTTEKTLPRVDSLPPVAGDPDGTARLRVTFPGGEIDEIVVSPTAAELQVGGVKGMGRAAYVRRRTIGEMIGSGVLGAAIGARH